MAGLDAVDVFFRVNSPQVELNFLKLTSKSSIEWFFLLLDLLGLLALFTLLSLFKRYGVLFCRFSDDLEVLLVKDLAEVQLLSTFSFCPLYFS